MVTQSADPDSYPLGQTPRFLLKKGTPREYDTLEFHVSTKAGMLWEYINPNAAQVPSLLAMPALPEPSHFQNGVTNVQELDPVNYTKYSRAWESYDRKQSLFLTQEKALVEVSVFLNQSVHPDHHWVYWKKDTLRERLIALKNEFKPSNNIWIYEVDARYKQALNANKIEMDTWLSTYWRAYTEAEEFQIPAVAGYYGHLHFLEAVNAFSPDFSVTQTAAVKKAILEGKDPASFPPVQKLVERFRSHMRLRKVQGVTAEQLYSES